MNPERYSARAGYRSVKLQRWPVRRDHCGAGFATLAYERSIPAGDHACEEGLGVPEELIVSPVCPQSGGLLPGPCSSTCACH